jgi:hypothetical protein
VIRNGLVYQSCLDYGQLVLKYEPVAPFEVDGIHYMVDRNRYCHRPMIELFRDGHVDFDRARQNWANPPSEAELDNWVHGYPACRDQT